MDRGSWCRGIAVLRTLRKFYKQTSFKVWHHQNMPEGPDYSVLASLFTSDDRTLQSFSH